MLRGADCERRKTTHFTVILSSFLVTHKPIGINSTTETGRPVPNCFVLSWMDAGGKIRTIWKQQGRGQGHAWGGWVLSEAHNPISSVQMAPPGDVWLPRAGDVW